MIQAAALLCSDCIEKVRCPASEQSEIAKSAFFALAKDETPNCNGYEPRWWRGIEGVRQ